MILGITKMKHAYEAINARAVEKPGPKKKPPKDTPETIAHKQWVASQPCMIPGCPGRSCVHHIREHGEPRDHFKTIPLCYDHHQGGPDGLHHMGKHAWRKKFGYEMDMLKTLMETKNALWRL